MKYILINAPNGQYTIPLVEVAEHRAKYYAEKDGFVQHSKEWCDEISMVMDDDYEGIDWLVNNTNFEDWSHVIKQVNNNVLVSEDDFWTSTDDFEIIEE